MGSSVLPFVLAACLAQPGDDDNWPGWRGPTSNGVAKGDAVLEWSETKNIIWKKAVPGRGHSSPVVVGQRVFLTTADEVKNLLSVLCYDRGNGELLWRKDVFEGGQDKRLHKKNTRASSTLVAGDGHVFALFYNDGAIWGTALQFNGDVVWKKKIGEFVSHWGYSASLAYHRDTVIVSTDHKEGGKLCCLDSRAGKVLWETPRPKAPTYATPVVLHVMGKDQIVMAGADQVISYDAKNGKQLWAVKGTSIECVSSAVAEGDRFYVTGGYPAKETLCIRGDGEVIWRAKVGNFVPSQLVYNGFLYSVLDNGVVLCLNGEDGKEMWKDRLSSSAFSASPVLVGDNLLIPSESGITHVFRANPKRLEMVAENSLGKQVFASPAVTNGQLFLRVVGEDRQEHLYCIGKK